METTQINIRIPVDLKAQGDSVLAEAGVSASELIRSLWEYLAIFRTIPEFGKMAGTADARPCACAPRGDAAIHASSDEADGPINQGFTMVQEFFARNGLHWENQTRVDYEDLREAAYAEDLTEYETLNA